MKRCAAAFRALRNRQSQGAAFALNATLGWAATIPECASSLIKADVADEVARLKQQPGQDILVAGSATLVQALMQHGLVDDFRLLVYPVVLGSGKRLFQAGRRADLKLVEARPVGAGVVALTYRTA